MPAAVPSSNSTQMDWNDHGCCVLGHVPSACDTVARLSVYNLITSVYLFRAHSHSGKFPIWLHQGLE